MQVVKNAVSTGCSTDVHYLQVEAQQGAAERLWHGSNAAFVSVG